MTLLDGLESVTFRVLGDPAPQGSKTATMFKPRGGPPRAGLRDANPKTLRPWRQAVAAEAQAVAGPTPLDGPLALTVHFRFSMPASRPKRIRVLGVWWCSVKPDIDKLVRAIMDSMKDGGLIRDDARVCDLHATKTEVVGWTGATVTVGPAGQVPT